MYGLTSSGGSTILPSGADATKKCICSTFIPDLFALMWIYDVETRTTRALCWTDESTMLMMENLLGQADGLGLALYILSPHWSDHARLCSGLQAGCSE